MIKIEDYLDSDRLKHSLQVMKKANDIANIFNLNKKEIELVTKAAELHDIGYSDNIKKHFNFHPLDGYIFLKGKVDEKIAVVVLLHSHAKYLSEHQDKPVKTMYESTYREIKNIDEIEMYVTIISMADMLIDGKGNECTPLERYNDIANRYGVEDYRAKIFKLQMNQLYSGY